MCQYCSLMFNEGWGKLLEYDEVYQNAMAAESTSTYGFHDSWDDLKESVY